MTIKINAEQVASKLALYDTQTVYYGLTRQTISESDIMELIDGKVYEQYRGNLQYFYQKQHEYYFENLTNLQL